MADMDTSYGADGRVTTTTQGPDVSDMRQLFMDMARRQMQPRQQAQAPPFKAAPVQPMAIPGMPASGQVYRQLADRGRIAPGAMEHSFVAYNHGPQQMAGYSDAPEGPNTFYGGARATSGNSGGTQFANTPGQSSQAEAYRRGAQDDDFARFQARSKQQQNIGYGLNPDGSEQGGQQGGGY